MIKTIKLLTAGLVLTTLLSCNGGNKSNKEIANSGNDTTNNGTTIFKATLKGSSEVPPNQSTASGNCTLTYNNAAKDFTAVTSYSGITPSMGHIHIGIVGQNGPVVFPFTNLASPITFNSGTLTSEQISDLFNGSLYVNLHTTAYPGGEIRGQLIKQ